MPDYLDEMLMWHNEAELWCEAAKKLAWRISLEKDAPPMSEILISAYNAARDEICLT